MLTSLRARWETEREELTGFGWWWRSLLTCPYCLTYWIGLQLALVMWQLPDGWQLTSGFYAALTGFCTAHLVNLLSLLPSYTGLPVGAQPAPAPPVAKLVIVHGPEGFRLYQARDKAPLASVRAFYTTVELYAAAAAPESIASSSDIRFGDGTLVNRFVYTRLTDVVFSK